MRWALAAAAGCACFFTVAFSTLVPLREPTGIQYLFVWPGGVTLATIWALSVLAITLAYALVALATRRRGMADVANASSGRWLAPIAALAVMLLGIAPAIPGAGEPAAVVGYWFYDLRWWWLALLVGWTVARADGVLGAPIRRRLGSVASWSQPSRLLFFDAMVFIAVVAWAIVTSPPSRFAGTIAGDEPKYMRYCELWYQGGGLAVSNKTAFADQSLDAPPRALANGVLAMRAVAEETHALARDLSQFARDPAGFRWNRISGRFGFVTGKHGGTYQLHQPGISAVIFPGYFLDRYLFAITPTYEGEFPAELFMTHLTMLLVYGACGVAMFRLLRRALGSEALASLWAALAAITLPPTAFAFQFYPELPALLIVLTTCNFVLFHARRSRRGLAFVAGAALGTLAWLHPRFLAVTAVLTMAAIAVMTGRPRRAFAAGVGIVVFSVVAFIYHVSGSGLPSALYDAQADEQTFSTSGLLVNLIGYASDREWGMLPHSPVLAGVLPGLMVLGRASWRRALFVAALGLTLAVTAAGHSLSAAVTSPGRLIVAVIPLFIWPTAVVVRRFWHSNTVRIASVCLAVLALDAAFSYNWTNDKQIGSMHDTSATGWKPNLAFPVIRGGPGPASIGNALLLPAFVSIIGVLSALAYRHGRRERPPSRTAPRRLLRQSALMIALLVAGSFASTAATRDWIDEDYLMADRTARRRGAATLVEHDRCRVCFTSGRRQVDWKWLEPNPAGSPRIDVGIERQNVSVLIKLGTRGDIPGFGRAAVSFGDGTETGWAGVVGERELVHHYRQPGEFRLQVSVELRDRLHVDRRTIEIRADR